MNIVQLPCKGQRNDEKKPSPENTAVEQWDFQCNPRGLVLWQFVKKKIYIPILKKNKKGGGSLPNPKDIKDSNCIWVLRNSGSVHFNAAGWHGLCPLLLHRMHQENPASLHPLSKRWAQESEVSFDPGWSRRWEKKSSTSPWNPKP